MTASLRASTFELGDLPVHRIGYGAMQLAGPGVFGPPKDRAAALAVLRAAVEAGVDHIDTSDFYGPYVTNELIREALHPYRDDLVIVTKIGARRGDDGAWLPAYAPDELKRAVHDNLRRLQLDAIDVVNLRIMFSTHGPAEGSIEQQLTALAELQQQGLVRHIGLSNVTRAQVEEGRKLCEIVCVQNHYNLVHRADDALIDALAADGIAYVPFFPAGRFFAAAIVGAVRPGRTARRDPDAGRAGLAAAPFAEPAADSGHLVGGAFARKPGGGRSGPVRRRAARTRRRGGRCLTARPAIVAGASLLSIRWQKAIPGGMRLTPCFFWIWCGPAARVRDRNRAVRAIPGCAERSGRLQCSVTTAAGVPAAL